MARRVHEGNTKVVFVETLDDASGPTTAELDGGQDMSRYITKDGLNTPQTQNMVDSSTLADIFDAQIAGSWGGALEITSFRDDSDDVVWDTFSHGTTGYFVVRRLIPYDDAWANGQSVEVYPIQSHQPIPSPSAANEEVRLSVMMGVTSEPDLKAVVGGGS